MLDEPTDPADDSQDDDVDPDPIPAPISVLGLRARRGPYEHLALRLESPLTALYGLNGAGKTWALRALLECGAGLTARTRVDEYVQLLVEAPSDSELFGWIVDNTDAEDTYAARHAFMSRRHLSDRRSDARRLREAARRAVRVLLAPGHADDFIDDHAEALDELASQRVFALVAVGRERAEWEVWQCAPPLSSSVRSPLQTVLADTWAELVGVADALSALEAREQDISSEDLDNLDDALRAAASSPWVSWLRSHRSSDDWLDVLERTDDIWDLQGDGLPVPVLRLCSLRDWTPVSVLGDVPPAELSTMTAGRLRDALWGGPDFRTQVDPRAAGLLTWVNAVGEQANGIFSGLLLDAPRLELAVGEPLEWLVGAALEWRAGGRAIADLSRAEARWAAFAIRCAVGPTPDLVVIDEPEAALHRAAEEHLANGLDRVSLDWSRTVVATHSPMLIDTPGIDVFEVSRDVSPAATGRASLRQGRTSRLRRLGDVERQDLERLGMQPSDLLRRTRVFVLVEGEHDRIVIERACREELVEARARVLAMRGGEKLPVTLESQVLFDYTDAHLVAVLDALDVGMVTEGWRDAQLAALAGSPDDGVRHLLGLWHGRREEYTWIRKWLIGALERGVSGRFTPLGLRARDIIEYLPVDALVPAAGRSWEELRQQHDEELAARPTTERDFKRWLTQRYRGDSSVPAVRAAAEAMTETPAELRELGLRIRSIGLAVRVVPS